MKHTETYMERSYRITWEAQQALDAIQKILGEEPIPLPGKLPWVDGLSEQYASVCLSREETERQGMLYTKEEADRMFGLSIVDPS